MRVGSALASAHGVPAGDDRGGWQFAAMHTCVHGGEHRPVPLLGGHEIHGRAMGDLERQAGPAWARRRVLPPLAAREDGSVGPA